MRTGKRFRMLLTAMLMLLMLSGFSTAALAAETWVLPVGGKKTVSGYSQLKFKGTGNAELTTSKTKITVKAVKEGQLMVKCYKGKKVSKKVRLLIIGSPAAFFDTSTLYLKKGSSASAQVSLFKKYSGCKVSYKSSKKSVATVSKTGKITARKKGTARITAKVTYKGAKVAVFRRTVKVTKKDTSSKNKAKYTVYDGKYHRYTGALPTAGTNTGTNTGAADSTTGKTLAALESDYNGSSPLKYNQGAPKRSDFQITAVYTDGTRKQVTTYSMKSDLAQGSWTSQFSYTENGVTVSVVHAPIPVEKTRAVQSIQYKHGQVVPVNTDLSRDDFRVTVVYEVSGAVTVDGTSNAVSFGSSETSNGIITVTFFSQIGGGTSLTLRRAG